MGRVARFDMRQSVCLVDLCLIANNLKYGVAVISAPPLFRLTLRDKGTANKTSVATVNAFKKFIQAHHSTESRRSRYQLYPNLFIASSDPDNARAISGGMLSR